VTVTFGLGELSATDSERFEVELVADSDSSDVLVAFGLNGLLVGSDAHDIALAPGIEADPANLSLSLSGEAGDGSVLLEMLDVDRRSLAGLDGATLGGFWASSRAAWASRRRSRTARSRPAAPCSRASSSARPLVSGVNVDEELSTSSITSSPSPPRPSTCRVVNQVGEELLSTPLESPCASARSPPSVASSSACARTSSRACARRSSCRPGCASCARPTIRPARRARSSCGASSRARAHPVRDRRPAATSSRWRPRRSRTPRSS
jgi:hypothetical protein